jgi:hypothetical protein
MSGGSPSPAATPDLVAAYSRGNTPFARTYARIRKPSPGGRHIKKASTFVPAFDVLGL